MVLFAYQTKKLRISKQSLYKLIYRRKLILVIDYRSHKESIIKRLLEITDKVPQLRTNARRAIKKAQVKLEKIFNKKEVKF